MSPRRIVSYCAPISALPGDEVDRRRDEGLGRDPRELGKPEGE